MLNYEEMREALWEAFLKGAYISEEHRKELLDAGFSPDDLMKWEIFIIERRKRLMGSTPKRSYFDKDPTE